MSSYTPKLDTSGVGSLPFREECQAVEFVLQADLDVPFWPQLPRRDFREQMVPQYAEDMPGVSLDADAQTITYRVAAKYEALSAFLEKYLAEAPFPISPDHARGLPEFVKAAGQRARHAVKGQVTGPITFTTGITTREHETLYGDHDLRDAAIKLLSQKASWQIKQLRELADTVIIFVDEPVLAAFGSSAYVGISEADVIGVEREITSAIRAAGALSGIHICGNCDWSVVIRTGADILNFDAYRYGDRLSLYGGEIHRFLERGGCIAWGIVPTTAAELRGENAASLVNRFQTGVDKLAEKGVPESLILDRSLLTPACGCGNLGIAETRQVFSLLRQVRTRCRDRLNS